MRIRTRAFLRSALFLSFVAGTLGPLPALAGSVGSGIVGTNTFTEYFGGVVTGAAAGDTLPPNVAATDPIGGYFAYFTSPAPSGGNGLYNFTNTTGPSLYFSITTPGTTTSFTDYSVVKGSYSVQVSRILTGLGATLDIHALTNAGASADVILTSANYYSLHGLALPTSTTIASFLTTPGRLVWDPNGQSIISQLTSFNGQSVNGQSVPEPSSLVLALVAMTTGVGFIFCRRDGKSV